MSSSPALRFGTAIHLGLETYLTSGSVDAALSSLWDAPHEHDDHELAKALTALRGYDARWRDDGLTTIAVESTFRTPLRNPSTGRPSQTFALAGKIDAIVRDADGRYWIMEHKTTSRDISPGSEYWRRLRLDAQVSIYHDGARSLGYDIEGCIYDVIAMPPLRALKATPEDARKYKSDGSLYAKQREHDETAIEYAHRIEAKIKENPDACYQRGVVVRLADEIDNHRRDLWDVAKMMRMAEIKNWHPKNAQACSMFHRTCEYFDLCVGDAQEDDPSRYIYEKPHSELES